MVAADRGVHRLFCVALNNPTADPQIIQMKNYRDVGQLFSVSKGQVVFSMADWNAPHELFTIDLDSFALNQVTSLNTHFLSQIDPTIVEEYWIKTSDGLEVQGWLFTPPGLDRQEQTPVVLALHGGPEPAWGRFSFRWPLAVFAAQGIPVLTLNPRGTEGYGLAFQRKVLEDWCGGPLQDDLEFLSAALKKWTFLDGSRVGLTGASYGGFSVNFLAHTKHFKAAVSHCGIADFKSFYYTTDELFFMEKEFGGKPFDDPVPPTYEKCSPINYINQINIPMLFIHGAKDYRIDVSQHMMMFTGLQRRNVPSTLVIFDRGSHFVSHPSDWLHWMDIIYGEQGWFKKHL
ncbi:hypothetical protein RCL1_003256 [Eukaryota sp. TZLM3-RCL]